MDIELFYDTSHHTTAEGARLRTERLLPHLRQRLPKLVSPSPLDTLKAGTVVPAR